jgi:phosphoenolpyruvate synthase/pyruvate phosphate dikinase
MLIIDTLRKVRQIFGNKEMDVEFTILDEKVYILQARYITTPVSNKNSTLEIS